MQVGMHINDADLAAALKSYVERRLHFALGRYGGRVGQVTVRIGTEGPADTLGRLGRRANGKPFGQQSDRRTK